MTIYVASSNVKTTWNYLDGTEEKTTEVYDVLRTFRKLTDAVAFVNGYDYYSDESCREILMKAEIESIPRTEVWVNENTKKFEMCTTVEFNSQTTKIEYELYIDEMELE